MRGNIVTIEKTGRIVKIAEDDLCKGDILLFQAGDLVQADLKLVEARWLEVDEFDLTGEIMPVDKKVDGEDVFVYRGSRVTRGNGKGVVVATGDETEYGKILKQRWGQVKYKFPSLLKMRYLALPALLLPPFVVSIARYGNFALICALYLAMTFFIALMQNNELFKYVFSSREVRKIASSNIHVNDETSLETIDRVDTVCFDKTGVLTTREMEVERVFEAEASDIHSSLPGRNISEMTRIACALCTDVLFLEKLAQADPVDRALISFASKNGVDVGKLASKYKRIYDKPFDSEERYMACGYEFDHKEAYFAKGDPDVILKMCKNYVTASGSEEKTDSDFFLSITAKTRSINQEGDVAIALAHGYGTSETPPLHYSFLCLLQLTNPVKPGASGVVKNLKKRRKRSLVLTGDRPETAMKVAGEIGIDNTSNHCLTGKHMARMEFSEIGRQSEHNTVFARLSPSQKGILVMQMQQRNHCVAMVGDGANDTIALRVVDVGISFVENSSPLAKRVAKILVNDLGDLLTLFKSARRMKQRIKYLKLLRAIVSASILLVLYLQMLT